MRKFTYIIAMMLMVTSFAFGKNISELDGSDWLGWSVQKKIGFVQGVMAGHASLRDRFAYEGMEDGKLANEYFYIPFTPGKIAQGLDIAYRSNENRDIPIYIALYIIVSKDYWNENAPEGNNENERSKTL